MASFPLPATRDALPTPCLVVDGPALARNIAAMAAWAARAGIALRPHAKTHKSGEIARRQLAAGAVGICCAKLAEAETLAVEGMTGLLITSPVVSAQAVARLAALNACSPGLKVVVDNPANVGRLADAVTEPLDVLIDIDPGFHRTGVPSAVAAVALAARISDASTLRYRGVQYYCGPHQHIQSFEQRSVAIGMATDHLRAVIAALADAGFAPEIVTGGGTGSCAIDAELGVLNELQPGSYVFMDREYRDCELERGAPRFESALAIDTRVVSANTPGMVTVDAGLKAMATEAGPPVVLAGADPASRYIFMGDEHGGLLTPAGTTDPGLDQRITLQPPHCDPTVNLYDHYIVCDGDRVTDAWPVTARGRSW